MFIGVCVCVVSSYGSLGFNANNVKWATQSFVHPEIPPHQPCCSGNGLRSQPHSNTGVRSHVINQCVCVGGCWWRDGKGVCLSSLNMIRSQEKKMRTRIDGGNKEDKKKEKQQKDKWSAQAEYEFAELTLQSSTAFSKK